MKDSFRPLILMQLGLILVFSLLLSLFLGLWIDRVFHTSPWGTLIFMLVGIAAGTLGVYRLVASAFDEIMRRPTDKP